MAFCIAPRSAGRASIVGFIAGMMFTASASCAQANLPEVHKKSGEGFARTAEEIARRIENSDKPFKAFISPKTMSAAQAHYYKKVQKRIEDIVAENFPTKNGKKLYGEVVVSIPIYQNGSLFLGDSGPRIEKSSGNADLDSATLEIIRRAAPFDSFPPDAISRHKDDVWIIIDRLNFARQEALQSDAPSE